MGSKLKSIYDQVSKYADIGTFDNFNSAMTDSGRRKKFFDGVSSLVDLGDWNKFDSTITADISGNTSAANDPRMADFELRTDLTRAQKDSAFEADKKKNVVNPIDAIKEVQRLSYKPSVAEQEMNIFTPQQLDKQQAENLINSEVRGLTKAGIPEDVARMNAIRRVTGGIPEPKENLPVEKTPEMQAQNALKNIALKLGIEGKGIEDIYNSVLGPLFQGAAAIAQGGKDVQSGNVVRGAGEMASGGLETAIGMMPGVVALNTAIPGLTKIAEKTAESLGYSAEDGQKVIGVVAPFIFGKWVGAGSLAGKGAEALTDASGILKGLDKKDQDIAKDLIHNLAFFATAMGGGAAEGKFKNYINKQIEADLPGFTQKASGSPMNAESIPIYGKGKEFETSGERANFKTIERKFKESGFKTEDEFLKAMTPQEQAVYRQKWLDFKRQKIGEKEFTDFLNEFEGKVAERANTQTIIPDAEKQTSDLPTIEDITKPKVDQSNLRNEVYNLITPRYGQEDAAKITANLSTDEATYLATGGREGKEVTQNRIDEILNPKPQTIEDLLKPKQQKEINNATIPKQSANEGSVRGISRAKNEIQSEKMGGGNAEPEKLTGSQIASEIPNEEKTQESPEKIGGFEYLSGIKFQDAKPEEIQDVKDIAQAIKDSYEANPEEVDKADYESAIKALDEIKTIPEKTVEENKSIVEEKPEQSFAEGITKQDLSQTETQGATEEKPKYDYSSTQVNIPEAEAKPFRDLANSIPDKELYEEAGQEYGRETEPHVTALYGLETENPKEVEKVVKDFGDVELELGKTSLFQNDKYDVLKVDVKSEDLKKLNKLLGENLDYKNDFPDYKPHLTIAYLKPGEGEKYSGDNRFEGQKIKLSELLFSNKDRSKTKINLTPSQPNTTAQPESQPSVAEQKVDDLTSENYRGKQFKDDKGNVYYIQPEQNEKMFNAYIIPKGKKKGEYIGGLQSLAGAKKHISDYAKSVGGKNLILQDKPGSSILPKEEGGGIKGGPTNEELKKMFAHAQDVPETKFAEVKNIPMKDINIDEGRFQNRAEPFSEETASSIEQGFKPEKFEPIVTWKDPKDGKDYILAGHSRYEGMRRRGVKEIPTMKFEGNEQEAINFARIESNRKATSEDLLADVRAYKQAKEAGYTKQQLLDNFKKESKIKTLDNYSNLNENGQFLKSLNSDAAKSYPYLERNASWIGELRKTYPQLTDAHETELFDYFYRGKEKNSFINKNDLYDKVENRVADLTFKPEQKLSLDRLESTGSRARSDTRDIQKKVDDLKARNRELNNLAKGATPEQKGIFQKEIMANIDQINKLEENIGEIINSQIDIFGQLDEKVKNDAITEDRANEIISGRNADELRKSAENIERKAESDSEEQRNEAIREADEIVSPTDEQALFQKNIPDKIEVNGKERPTRDNKGNLIHPTEEGTKNFWNNFADSKVVDEEGRPVLNYSGHSNAPLYKNFDPKKSTAGGFYASEDPLVASGYATGKFGSKEGYENGSQYRIKGKNGEYNKKLWQIELTEAQKKKLDEIAGEKNEYDEDIYRINEMMDWAKNNKNYEPLARRILARGKYDLQNIFDYNEMMGYNIAYPETDKPGESNPLFMRQRKNDTEEIMDKLGVEWQSYDWNQPGIMPVYLNITNPLDADKPFPQDLLKALKDAAKYERTKSTSEISYDTWTKEYPLKEWIRDIEDGSEGWTTQIPKKALSIIKKFGYDGIKERGMKGMAGELPREQRQINWIAFEPEQIKSATSNKGKFSTAEKDMLKQDLDINAGRTDLQKLQDRKKHLELVIDNPKSDSKTISQAQGELSSINSQLKKLRSKESQYDFFGDAQDQQSLFREHTRTQTVFNKMTEAEQKKFLDELQKGINSEWLIGQKNLTKEQAAGVTYLLRKAIDFDPRTADFTTAWEESFHASIIALAKPYAAKNLLRQAGWDGKGEITDVNGNPSLRDAHEKLAKKYIKFRQDGDKTKDSRMQKVFTAIKEFFNKLYNFLRGKGFVSQSEYFRNLRDGKLKAEQVKKETKAQREAERESILNQAKKITDTPEFKKWFGDSKVINEKGDPLIVYHGQPHKYIYEGGREAKKMPAEKFEVFTNNNPRFLDKNNRGFYFTPDKYLADRYAAGGNVYPVFLSLKNPFIYENKYHYDENRIVKNPAFITQEEAKKLQDMGYDGLIQYGMGTKKIDNIDQIVAFKSNQIKSIDNSGAFNPDDPNILNASFSPVWYSKLEKVIEEKAPNKNINPISLKAMLKNNGVKDEEIKWLDVDNFLKENPKATKQELLDYVKANQVEIKEVAKGAGNVEKLEAEWKDAASAVNKAIRERLPEKETNRLRDIRDNLRDKIEEAKQSPSETKFSQWKLPGGENYREVLYVLPAKNTRLSIQEDSKGYSLIDAYGNIVESGLAREIAIRRAKKSADVEQTQFKSSHWDEPNVLAHVRLQDFTDTEGRKLLLVDEAQSDWGQQGRKIGYRDDAKLEELKKELPLAEAEYNKLDFNNLKLSEIWKTPEAQRVESIREEIHKLNNAAPPMPFEKTWHELTLKRVLRMAAEEGYDGIAITPGSEQADRYDLRNHVDKIKVNREVDGGWHLIAEKNGNKLIDKYPQNEKGLEELVGKELATKIINDNVPITRDKIYTGDDLRVGGEGMRGFYDKIIPDFLNKYAKKWGAEVGETIINAEGKDFDSWLEEKYPNEVNSQIGAQDRLRLIKEWEKQLGNESTKVHFLPVTDEMRRSILFEGQPLFQRLEQNDMFDRPTTMNYLDRIAKINNPFELKNWKKKHYDEIMDMASWERDEIIDAWNEQARVIRDSYKPTKKEIQEGYQSSMIFKNEDLWNKSHEGRKIENKYEDSQKPYLKHLEEANKVWESGKNKYTSFTKGLKEVGININPADAVKLYNEVRKRKIAEEKKNQGQETTIIPKPDLIDKENDRIKQDIKKALYKSGIPEEKQTKFINFLDKELDHYTDAPRTKNQWLRILAERFGQVTKLYGKAGGEMANLMAEGNVKEVKIGEGGYEFIEKAQEIYDEIEKEDFGTDKIIDYDNKIKSALEDRQNAQSYLGEDERLKKIYKYVEGFYDYYKDLLQKENYPVLDDYFSRQALADEMSRFIDELPEDVKPDTQGLHHFVSATSSYLKHRTGGGEARPQSILSSMKGYNRSVARTLAYKDAINYYLTDFKKDIPLSKKNQSIKPMYNFMVANLTPDKLYLPGLSWLRNNMYFNQLSFNVKTSVQNWGQKYLADLYASKEATQLTSKFVFDSAKSLKGNLRKAYEEIKYLEPDISRSAKIGEYDPQEGLQKKITEKINKVEPFSISEKSNWSYAELLGIKSSVVNTPEYQKWSKENPKATYDNKIDKIDELLGNPGIFKAAVREGRDLAANTQISPTAAYRPEIFEKEWFRKTIGMYRRFPLALAEHTAKAIFGKLEGADGLNAQRLLRKGITSESELIDKLDAFEYFRKKADRYLEDLKSGKRQPKPQEIEFVEAMIDHWSGLEKEINKEIKTKVPTGSRIRNVRKMGKLYGYAILASTLFQIIYNYSDNFHQSIFGEKGDKKSLAKWNRLTRKQKDDLVWSLATRASFDAMPLPFYGGNIGQAFVTPVLPNLEWYKYGKFNPRGVAKTGIEYGLNVIPGAGLINRISGRAISNKLLNVAFPRKKSGSSGTPVW